MPTYRIFCDKKQSKSLPKELKVEETYAGFCIVSGPESAIQSLKKKLPIEKLVEKKKRPGPRSSLLAAARAAPTSGKTAAQNRNYRVRFKSPIKKAWITALEKAGAQVIDREGGSSLILRCPTKKVLEAVDQHSAVRSMNEYTPVFKVSNEFLSKLRPGGARVKATKKKVSDAAAALAAGKVKAKKKRASAVPGAIVALFFSDKDARRAQKSLSAQGVKTNYVKGSNRLVIDFTSTAKPADAFLSLAQREGLKRVETLSLKRLFNDVAREIIADNVVNATPAATRLTGKGEIIAVADSGLDTGDASTLHLDFAGRVVDLSSFPIHASYSDFITNPGGDDGPADTSSGHGTHVAGSVLGNGARSAALGLPPIQGVAPEAQLVFQAIEQTPQWTFQAILEFLLSGENPPVRTLFGIPESLGDLFGPAFNKGARIHSNSWGGGDPGEYDDQCESLDQFVWDHKDFLVVVAAGNDGTDSSPPNGTVDQPSVSSPGTAKNCLTVGASENDRGNVFSSTYGGFWPDDYPQAPLKDDIMVDNINDVVAFSSRGPCLTGRRKPDVIAPGTFVLSTRSSQIASNNFAWAAFPAAKQDYMFMGGTSMATPLVSGCAALVRQHLRENEGISKPSAALMKAAIIHSSKYLAYRFAHPASAPFADNEQGWGRVELASVLAPKSPRKVVFLTASGLQTGSTKEFTVRLSNANAPLKVTLAYTDSPGEQLVNNLNLIVTSPSGHFRFGNDFDGTGAPDGDNNVEGVVVSNPAGGDWNIKVVASEVQVGPQDFAIVISGPGAKIV